MQASGTATSTSSHENPSPRIHDIRQAMQHPNTPLLHLPLELRHEIYTYILPAQIHLRLENEHLRISPCLEPDRNKRSANSPCDELTLVGYDGYERGVRPSGVAGRVSGQIWARRLESGWGPHWGC